jgi:PAS domain S-box-containing protein
MQQATSEIERTILEAVQAAPDLTRLAAVLESIPAPLYVTDAEGLVTHFNSYCAGLTGRTPLAGRDRWCVTWRLFSDDGEFLPHDQCPMAKAIQTGRPIRGMTAFAQRPNGSKVRFMPFPTPIFAGDGTLAGAVNMLIDVTEPGQPADLRQQALHCRELAATTSDPVASNTLRRMEREFEIKADAVELLVLANVSLPG